MTLTHPAISQYIKISYPSPSILLVTMDRGYNMLNMDMQHSLSNLWKWYDNTPSLRCAVITGSSKAFCAGADLKEWLETRQSGGGDYGSAGREVPGGFGGMSRRAGKKPIIAAVNGLCLGGGMEMTINADLVIASETSEFGLPEVKRGVFAKMGGLGRIIRFVGLQRASELALTGDSITAQKAYEWGLVNKVVPASEVLKVAIDYATKIASNSPDAVIVSRLGLLYALEHGSLERGTQLLNEGHYVKRLEGGENIEEGLRSFKEKRNPVWKDSKL